MSIKARLAIIRYEDVIVDTSSFEEARTQLWARDYGDENLEQIICLEAVPEHATGHAVTGRVLVVGDIEPATVPGTLRPGTAPRHGVPVIERCPVHQEAIGDGRVCIACDGGVF